MFHVVRKRQLILALLALLALALCLLLPFLWGAAEAAFSGGVVSVKVPVLMYHSIITNPAKAGQYVVPVTILESDFQWLQAHDYTAVTTDELIEFVHSGASLPEKPVLITFDDGYLNNLTLLPDLLERYDLCALISVVGEYCDIYTGCGDDGSAFAGMSWENVAEAEQEPRLEIGNHSYYFHHLSARKGCGRKRGEKKNDWAAALSADAMRMQTALKTHCGEERLVFTYPYGQISDGADEILREQGFRMTLSCYERITQLTVGDADTLFSIGRFNRDGRIGTEMFMKAHLPV